MSVKLTFLITEALLLSITSSRYIFKYHLDHLGSGLTSHHMKMLYYRYLDQNYNVEQWTEANSGYILRDLLLYITSHLEREFIPHYMIANLNLAKGGSFYSLY